MWDFLLNFISKKIFFSDYEFSLDSAKRYDIKLPFSEIEALIEENSDVGRFSSI